MGHHQYKVEVVSNEGVVIGEKESTFIVKNYEGKIYIDSPVRNEKVKTELNYQGWAMSDDPNSEVEIYIDGEKQEDVQRYEREDVLNAISGYGGREANKKPGFRGTIDVSDLKDGSHTMAVRVVTEKGTIISESSTVFQVYKYDTKMDVDNPYNNQTVMEELRFRGWVMSEDENHKVRILIDGKEIENSFNKESRKKRCTRCNKRIWRKREE